MSAPANAFKKALAEGRVQIGLWQAMASPIAAEISANMGFDWLLFDGEHAPNNVPSLLAQLQAVSAYPVHPVARPPYGETRIIKQYLDIGFQTLLIPLVETPEQAAELVRAVRYPPEGVRGVGFGIARAAQWGKVRDYIHTADAEICLLVQVETMLGMQNLDAIAATPGVDGVFIGPSDLSAAMGFRGQPSHPEVVAAIEDAGARIKAAGKAPGILTVDQAVIRRCLDLGYLFVAVGTDTGLLSSGGAALAKTFKPG